MKKTVSWILLSLVLLTSLIMVSAHFENASIVDEAGYLTEEQLNEISEALDGVRWLYDFDVAIYTEKSMSGINAQSTADDLYDNRMYGCGGGADGIMLYIAADERVYHFTTHGVGETIFDDDGLTYLESMILPSLREGDYAEAMALYAEYTEEILEKAAQGETQPEQSPSIGYVCTVIGCALILPLLWALWRTSGKLKKMKTAVENDYAANYMKPGSMNLSFSRDIFLYSTVTKTEKPKQNSGGHVSSSGEHHGGRGGSF